MKHGSRTAAGAVALSIVWALAVGPTAFADETPTPSDTSTSTPSDPTPTDTSSPTPSSSSSSTPPPSTSSTSSSSTSSTSPSPSPSTTTPSGTSTPSGSSTPSAISRPPWTLPTGSSGSGGGFNPNDTGEPLLSSGDIASQVAEADALRAKLAATNAVLSGLVTKLDELAKKSNQLLDSLAKAKDTEQEADDEALRQEGVSGQLTLQLADEREKLRAWAFYAYTEGGSVAEMVGIFDAMGKDPSQAGNPVGDLSYLTDARALAFASIQTLESLQSDATYRAEAARTTATAAAKTADEAKTAVDAVLAEQKVQVDALRKTQLSDLQKAGPLVGILAGAQTPEAKAAFAALIAELTKNGQSIPTTGRICSTDEGGYPNGMLPATALCPLWMAPGESLRPRAAAAFNSMSAAYAKDTGSPICVTDSYRSLSAQYSVKASRGMWAATPGTSPHGLGIALDLCGGIDSFGSPAHMWMQQNGPAYGWYHPAWAEPGGSLPEPWHWQFAG